MRSTHIPHHPTRMQVLSLVQEWMDAPQSESDGGWAPVGPKDMDALHAIIEALVAYRYEADPDGDRPVNWELCDRTRFEPVSVTFLPLLPDEEGAEMQKVLRQRFNIAMFNQQDAQGALSRAWNMLRHSGE